MNEPESENRNAENPNGLPRYADNSEAMPATANDLAKRVVAGNSQSSSEGARTSSTTSEKAGTYGKDKLDERWLAAIWRAFTEWFGRRFTSTFGTVPLDTWRYGLAGLTPHEIRRGLDLVRTSGEAWPPTLPEFRAMCRSGTTNTDDGASMASRMPFERRIPESEEKREARKRIAREWIEKCRKILG